jgi:hypothetical protein
MTTDQTMSQNRLALSVISSVLFRVNLWSILAPLLSFACFVEGPGVAATDERMTTDQNMSQNRLALSVISSVLFRANLWPILAPLPQLL